MSRLSLVASESELRIIDNEVGTERLVELVEVPKEGVARCAGTPWSWRDTLLGGEADAFIMLKEQHKMPRGWQKHPIAFVNSIWVDQYGNPSVPCLYCQGGTWCLAPKSVKDGFEPHYRYVRLRLCPVANKA